MPGAGTGMDVDGGGGEEDEELGELGLDLEEEVVEDRRRSGWNGPRSKEVMAVRRRQLIETRHREAGERPCRWTGCGRTCQSLEELVDHLHDDHLPFGPKAAYTCEWEGCDRYGEPQMSRFAVMQHLRRHTNERPFLCTLPDCGARFSRIDNLHKHWKAHEEESKLRLFGGAEGFGEAAENDPPSPGAPARRRGGGADDGRPTPKRRRGGAASSAAGGPAAAHEAVDAAGRAGGQRRPLSVAAGLVWYRRRCRQLAACFRYSLWENALLEADVADALETVRALKAERRALLKRHLHLQLLQARADIDDALDLAVPRRAAPLH